jgi:hypothetical protein
MGYLPLDERLVLACPLGGEGIVQCQGETKLPRRVGLSIFGHLVGKSRREGTVKAAPHRTPDLGADANGDAGLLWASNPEARSSRSFMQRRVWATLPLKWPGLTALSNCCQNLSFLEACHFCWCSTQTAAPLNRNHRRHAVQESPDDCRVGHKRATRPCQFCGLLVINAQMPLRVFIDSVPADEVVFVCRGSGGGASPARLDAEGTYGTFTTGSPAPNSVGRTRRLRGEPPPEPSLTVTT